MLIGSFVKILNFIAKSIKLLRLFIQLILYMNCLLLKKVYSLVLFLELSD